MNIYTFNYLHSFVQTFFCGVYFSGLRPNKYWKKNEWVMDHNHRHPLILSSFHHLNVWHEFNNNNNNNNNVNINWKREILLFFNKQILTFIPYIPIHWWWLSRTWSSHIYSTFISHIHHQPLQPYKCDVSTLSTITYMNQFWFMC